MINLVANIDGWILQRLATSFHEMIPDSKHSVIPDLNADANVYFPYYLMKEKTKRDIALFTHLEDETRGPGAKRKADCFREVAEQTDLCWAMSNATAKHLPPEKTFVLEPPPDKLFMRNKIRLGFCGIEQPFGRKRFDWIEAVSKIRGIEVVFTNGSLPFNLMPKFFRDIDYLVIAAENEGGPMPVKEAIASGTTVIAPDVGWAWEYPVLRYSSLPELIQLIERLRILPIEWDIAARTLELQCLGQE